MKSVLLGAVLLTVLTTIAISQGAPQTSRKSTRETRWLTDLEARLQASQLTQANTYRGTDRLATTTSSVDTFVLAEFDFEGLTGADPQGWTSIDLTAQTGTYWHVDDFMVPANGGNQAMWCGVETPVGELCGYLCLPGYGNDWSQTLETPNAFTVQGDVTLSFDANWDTEPGFDFFYVEYLDKDSDWIVVDTIDGLAPDTSLSYVVPATELDGSVRFRLRFESDPEYSDEDCNFDTNGAVRVDNITVTDMMGIVHFEDFEGEAVGAQVTDDGAWVAAATPGYGDYAGLLDGSDLFGAGLENDTYVWGFTTGSPLTCADSYNCYGAPCGPDTLHVVPGQGVNNPEPHLANEIRSPIIDWTHDVDSNPVDTGATQTLLQFRVYRNLTREGDIIYVSNGRSFAAGSTCLDADWMYIFTGGIAIQGDWYTHTIDISDLISPGDDRLQIALGVWDMSPYWCTPPACGDCVTVSPLFDDVCVIRVKPTATAVKEQPTLEYTLEANYPNPFNPMTTIRYSIKERAHVSLKIYDVSGQVVRTLVDDVRSPGDVAPVTWDGTNEAGQDVSSGVYFYRLVTKSFEKTRKMVLLK